MTTKQEVIDGLEFLIQEGKRLGDTMPADGWAKVQDSDGWKNTQVLAHIASISSIVAPFVTNMANADADANAGAGLDIPAAAWLGYAVVYAGAWLGASVWLFNRKKF